MAEQQNYKNHVQRPVAPIALTVLNLTLFITAIVGLVRQYDLLHWFCWASPFRPGQQRLPPASTH